MAPLQAVLAGRFARLALLLDSVALMVEFHRQPRQCRLTQGSARAWLRHTASVPSTTAAPSR